jgi:NMD protein affecting ribosome stability and mRNA decay
MPELEHQCHDCGREIPELQEKCHDCEAEPDYYVPEPDDYAITGGE